MSLSLRRESIISLLALSTRKRLCTENITPLEESDKENRLAILRTIYSIVYTRFDAAIEHLEKVGVCIGHKGR